MTHLPRPLAAAVLVWAVWAAPGVAQAELDGLTIREVEFRGLQLLSEATLQFYLGLEEGTPLDLDELDRNVHRLWARRLVEDIHLEAEPVEGGVKVIVILVERPTLVGIDYVGLKRISQTDISDRIARDNIQVREGDPLDHGELSRLKAAIEELYLEKGFRFSEASYDVETVSVGERRVTFTIDEGDRVRISEIDFEGNTVFGDRRLRVAMKKTKETGLVARFRKKDVFNAAHLEEDLDAVRALYRRAGYKDVVLGEAKLEVRAKDAGAAEADGEKRKLVVTIPIEEGERWKLGQISIEGNEQFGDELLLRLFEQPRGGWLRSNVIDDGVKALQEVYNNTGYIFARAETEIVERGENVADVVVQVDEGDQYRIGRIEFEGNTRTRDKVLRRQLAVQEGFVLNSGALRNSLLRIRQLEFFVLDEDDPVAFDFDADNKQVNLSIRGQEGDRTELQFGAGFSELDGFFGTLSFRTRNFLGRGETAAVTVQTGRFRNIFEISYFIPWFRDRPQSVGFELFKRDLDFDLLAGQTFFQDTQGGRVTYGRTLGLFRNVSLSYSRFDVEDRRTLVAFDGSLVEQEFVRDVSSLRAAYSLNRVDSRINPTVGYSYGGSAEYAGGVIGGSTNFVRALADFTLFRPITKGRINTVLGLHAEVGYIQPFGGEELFFSDRFFTGGENSVRGFRSRSIWVRDEDGATVLDDALFPLGGDKLFTANVEYHFLLSGPFRILLFADAGNVWGEDQSLDLNLLRYTAGVELRVTVPLFGQPLRFIYAINLDPIDDPLLGPDRFESFQFSLGTSF